MTAYSQEATDAAPVRRRCRHPYHTCAVDARDCSRDRASWDIQGGIDYRWRDRKVEELVGVDKVVVLVGFETWETGIDLLFWCIGVVMQ